MVPHSFSENERRVVFSSKSAKLLDCASPLALLGPAHNLRTAAENGRMI